MWVYNLYVHTEYFAVFIAAFQDNLYYFAFRSYGTAPVNLNIKTGGRVYGTTGKFIFVVASIGKLGIYLNKSRIDVSYYNPVKKNSFDHI